MSAAQQVPYRASPFGAGRTTEDALAVRGVLVRFGGVKAVDVDELVVPLGSITGIIGANGAGKTTLLDVISGFVRPSAGSVLLDGRTELVRLSPERRSRLGLGRLFQDARLFDSMTVAETLAVAAGTPTTIIDSVLRLPGSRKRERAIRSSVGELVEGMGVGDFYDKFINELSTGSRRIVELACILAQKPRVVLLDEPSSGIAQGEVERLEAVLRRVRDALSCTFVVIEHDIPLMRSLSDMIYAMGDGKVIAAGTPDEVLGDPVVISSYLGTSMTAISRSGRRTGGK